MKYYLYISQEKVNMLASQLRPGLSARVSKWNFGLGSGPLNVGIVGQPADPTVHSKVERIQRHIRKHEPCGTVDAPATFILDTVDVKWGPLLMDNKVVFFSGATSGTVFALGGSTSNLLQAPSLGASASLGGGSAQWILASALLDAMGRKGHPAFDPDAPSGEGALLAAVASLASDFRGPTTRIEFLAKTLVAGNPDKSFYSFGMKDEFASKDTTILGSPRYVAMAD